MLIRDHRIGFSSNVFFILKSLQRKKITLRNELLWDTESIVEQYSLPCDRCVTLGQYKLTSLRKLLTFRGTTNGFPAKWLLRNKPGEIPYWWCVTHYPDLASVFYWQCRERNFLQPIKSTIQIWVVKRHQYGISALVPQTSFRRETSVVVTSWMSTAFWGYKKRFFNFPYRSTVNLRLSSSGQSKVMGTTSGQTSSIINRAKESTYL